MSIHKKIVSGSPSDIERAKQDAKAAADRADEAKTEYVAATTARKTADADKLTADLTAAKNAAKVQVLKQGRGNNVMSLRDIQPVSGRTGRKTGSKKLPLSVKERCHSKEDR